jgi:hypothetical protein
MTARNGHWADEDPAPYPIDAPAARCAGAIGDAQLGADGDAFSTTGVDHAGLVLLCLSRPLRAFEFGGGLAWNCRK